MIQADLRFACASTSLDGGVMTAPTVSGGFFYQRPKVADRGFGNLGSEQ